MARRFWLGAALSAPLFAMVMVDDFLGGPIARAVSSRWFVWLQFALATPVVMCGGWPLFAHGWRSVVNRRLNMFTLIALGTGVAYLYSLVGATFPDVFAASFRGMHGEVPVYFEAAAVITTLVLLGQVLELRARSQTSSAIRALLDHAPATARRAGDHGPDDEIPLDQVTRGDRLRVRPGEKISSTG